MSNESHDLAYWLSQIEKLAGESATAEQLAELEELLLQNPSFRRVYAAWAQLQIDLQMVIRAEESLSAAAAEQGADEKASTGFGRGAPTSSDRPSHVELASPASEASRPSWLQRAALSWQSLATLVATVVTFGVLTLTFLMGLGIWTPNSQGPTGGEAQAAVRPTLVARLTALRDVQWANQNATLSELSYLSEGQEINLVSGLVEVTFRDGAKVLIEGPARLTVSSREQCDLQHGRLLARVPSQGMGFAVSTPLAIAVDMGSNFGVSVDADGTTEVHVLSGEIQLTVHPRQLASQWAPAERIVAERGRRIRPSGGAAMPIVETIAADASRFIHALGSRMQSNGVVSHPVMPPNPVAGFLYDRVYAKVRDPIADHFGTIQGWTVAANADRHLMNSSDTPFNYAGNQAIDTTAGNSGVNYSVGSFSTALSGASAITFQAWIKYQSGDLSSGSFTNRICVAHIDGDITVIDGDISVFMVSPNDTNTVSVAGRSLRSDSLQSMTTTATIVPGQWNQIVAILDFATDQIHVSLNGGAFETSRVEFGSNTLVPGRPTKEDRIPSSPFYSYTGLLDEIAIWDSAITADHVAWLSQNSLHGIAKSAMKKSRPSD